jgi:hypothetical protein
MPGFISDIEYYLDDKTVVVVLTNSYSSVAQDPVPNDIGAIVYDQLDRNIWARVKFQRDTTGKVTGFVYHILQDFNAVKVTD